MKPRTLLLFENSIKSEATRKLYNYALKKFVEYYKLRFIESILKIPDKKKLSFDLGDGSLMGIDYILNSSGSYEIFPVNR